MGIYTDGKLVIEVNHETLTDLLGGDGAGHFHNTSSMNTAITSPGVSGTIFTSQGSGAAPAWAASAASFGNIDGGTPTSTYGGVSPINCGGAS